MELVKEHEAMFGESRQKIVVAACILIYWLASVSSFTAILFGVGSVAGVYEDFDTSRSEWVMSNIHNWKTYPIMAINVDRYYHNQLLDVEGGYD